MAHIDSAAPTTQSVHNLSWAQDEPRALAG